MEDKKVLDVDTYLDSLPTHQSSVLRQVRQIIMDAVPEAEEVISYSMPAYKYHGMLVYFAAQSKHWGLYGNNTSIAGELAEELKNYSMSKGTIRFPYDIELPVSLIERIVRLRAAQNLAKSKAKKK